MRLITTFGLLLALGLGCAGLAELDVEPTPPPTPDWVGVWEGPGVRVIIGADGTVEVKRERNGFSSGSTLPATAFRDDAIVVGIVGFETVHALQAPPHEQDGQWTMTFDGTPLVRTSSIPQAPEAPRVNPLDAPSPLPPPPPATPAPPDATP